MFETIWNSPEHFGLKTFYIHDWSDGCYQFCYTALWFHEEDKKFYIGEDGGCSCPGPFEDYTKLEMLTEVTFEILDELYEKIASREVSNGYEGDDLGYFRKKLFIVDKFLRGIKDDRHLRGGDTKTEG